MVVTIETKVSDPVVEDWWIAGRAHTPGDKLVEQRHREDSTRTGEEKGLRIALSRSEGEGRRGSQHHARNIDRSTTRGAFIVLGRVHCYQIHKGEEKYGLIPVALWKTAAAVGEKKDVQLDLALYRQDLKCILDFSGNPLIASSHKDGRERIHQPLRLSDHKLRKSRMTVKIDYCSNVVKMSHSR